MSENPPEEPKLIIDEDWKTQVQREKEELKKREAEASQETPVAEGQEDTGEPTSA
jgi:hypothetical protein